MAREAIAKARISKAELAEWRGKATASGVSLSALMRTAMTRTHTWTAAARDIEEARNRELARIGNNLNQLARWANTYKHKADALQVLAHLSAIERDMHGLRIKGGGGDAD